MQKKFFLVMTSSMMSQGGLKISLYIHVLERVAPGANCKGNVSSINANIIIVFLGYTCQWITLFEIASQRSTSQAYWVTLPLISSIANYLKYNYFLDCDGIDNVTLRLWKISDFCSRHTVCVAGDDIMFHILVHYVPARPPPATFGKINYTRIKFLTIECTLGKWILEIDNKYNFA